MRPVMLRLLHCKGIGGREGGEERRRGKERRDGREGERREVHFDKTPFYLQRQPNNTS